MDTTNSNNTAATSDIAAAALEIATGYIGQQEEPQGSNWGPFVERCLQSVGITAAAPWCQAFVHLCFEEAAAKLGIVNPVVKSASVLDCWNRTDVDYRILKQDLIQHPELIKPGDQLVMKDGSASGHTGIIERVEQRTPNGIILLHTIEGNTNPTSGGTGHEVLRRIRFLEMLSVLGLIKR